MRGLSGRWAAGSGRLGMKSLFVTVVASLTLFAAGITAVYLTPPPERTGSKFVLQINAAGEATPEAGDVRPPRANEQALRTDPPADVAGESGAASVAANGPPDAAGASKPSDDVASRDALSDLQRRFDERTQPAQEQNPSPATPSETSIASSRAMENSAPKAASTGIDDPRLAFPRAPEEAKPEVRGADTDRLAASPIETPSQFSARETPVTSTSSLPDNAAVDRADTTPQAPAPGSVEDAALAKAFDATARQLENSWRTTAKQTIATMPTPPVPRKRAQSQPPIPRGAKSAAPQPATDVRTAGAEQRNAATTPLTATTGFVGKPLATPGAEPEGNPRIAIIVRYLGLDERDTYSAINALRPEVTLAFSPYGRDVKGWALRARQSGHEVFAGVPMEPVGISATEAAPYMLLASLPADENIRRLEWALDQIDGYQGVINIMGGKLAQSPDAMRPFMQTLQTRGLAYVDDGAAAHPYAIMLAAQVNARYRVADGKVGSQPSPSSIERELKKLEDIAKEKGSALAVANADAETLRQLVIWTATLPSKSITLVHASQIVKAVNLQ